MREELARPENEPKTQLGRRLRDIRRHLGDHDREEFAADLGISKAALAHYERGDRTPDADVLAAYREKYGINVNWLITGEGGMFDTSIGQPVSYHAAVVEKIARIVTAAHKDAGIRITPEKVVVETVTLFNDLLARVSDLNDAEEIDATLPQLQHILKKRLAEAAADPGSGKRSA